jgi:MFS family permease
VEQALQGNIWKYIVFNVTSARVYMPIIAIYLLTFDDIELTAIGGILATVYLAQFVIEVPSGYISDRIGHKTTLIITRVLFLLSSICFIVGGFELAVLGALAFGIGLAFVSGTLTAFMQETLEGLGRMHEYAKVIGRAQSTYLALSALLLIGIPATFALDVRAPFLIALVLDIIGLLVTLSFAVPEQSEQTQEVGLHNFASNVREAWSRGLVGVTVLTSLLFGIVLGTRTFQDAYQTDIGVSVIYLGALFALSKLVAAAIMRSPIHTLKNKLSFRQFVTMVAVVLLLIVFVLGLANNMYMVAAAFVLCTGVFWGVLPVFVHYKLDLISDSSHKATLLSIGGLLDSIILAGASVSVGMLVGWFSFQTGYLYYAVLGTVLVVLTLVIQQLCRGTRGREQPSSKVAS